MPGSAGNLGDCCAKAARRNTSACCCITSTALFSGVAAAAGGFRWCSEGAIEGCLLVAGKLKETEAVAPPVPSSQWALLPASRSSASSCSCCCSWVAGAAAGCLCSSSSSRSAAESDSWQTGRLSRPVRLPKREATSDATSLRFRGERGPRAQVV